MPLVLYEQVAFFCVYRVDAALKFYYAVGVEFKGEL